MHEHQVWVKPCCHLHSVILSPLSFPIEVANVIVYHLNRVLGKVRVALDFCWWVNNYTYHSYYIILKHRDYMNMTPQCTVTLCYLKTLLIIVVRLVTCAQTRTLIRTCISIKQNELCRIWEFPSLKDANESWGTIKTWTAQNQKLLSYLDEGSTILDFKLFPG